MDDQRRDFIAEEINESLKDISYALSKILEQLEKLVTNKTKQ